MFSFLNLTNVHDNCAGLLEFGRAAHVRLGTCSQRQEGEKVWWLLLVLRLLGRPNHSLCVFWMVSYWVWIGYSRLHISTCSCRAAPTRRRSKGARELVGGSPQLRLRARGATGISARRSKLSILFRKSWTSESTGLLREVMPAGDASGPFQTKCFMEINLAIFHLKRNMNTTQQ